MSKTVGIPRGLFFYNYYPLWKTFFEELGAEVIISDWTTKKILDDGTKSCVDEACLPIKLYHGHVLNLKDRVDYLFVPRLTSVSKNEYICPEIGGLPDMLRHSLKGLPEIIDTEVNLRKSNRNALKAALEIGSYFSSSKFLINNAYQKSLQRHKTYKEMIKNGELPCDLLDKRKRKDTFGKGTGSGSKLNIALIGHPYNLYDSFINMDMVDKLKANNVNIVTVEMIDNQIIYEENEKLAKRIFWNFGRKAMGTTMHIIERNNFDGIIYTMTFGCGVDSFICDLVERRIRRESDIPFIVLTIDEHSGEAGMDTRLEAFIDMIRWRKRNEGYVPTYG